MPEEKNGLIPDREFLNTQYGKWGWSKGTMLNLTIGQGESLVTPLQLLQFANFIATVEKYEDDQRIWVLMDLMGRKSKILTPSDTLHQTN